MEIKKNLLLAERHNLLYLKKDNQGLFVTYRWTRKSGDTEST